MKVSLRALIMILAVAVTLGGCASSQVQKTESTEQLLLAAGFQQKFADTPQKQAHLQALPQRTLLAYPYKGKVVYVYRDVNTLYMGTPEAYRRYQQLAVEKQIAKQLVEAAEINETTDWGMWGWGYY